MTLSGPALLLALSLASTATFLIPAVQHIRSTTAWQGQLQIVDNAFVDSRGAFVMPVCLHAGDLFGRFVALGEAHVEPVLESAARVGFNCLRSWTTLNARGAHDDAWSNKTVSRLGPHVTSNYRQQMVAFAQLLMVHGLRWHQAQGDLTNLNREQRNEVFDELAAAVSEAGPESFALIEGLNEARDTGVTDPREVERLINRVRQRIPGPLYALSAYTGTEERDILRAWTPDWMPFFVVHSYRGGHWYDKRRHIWSITYDGEQPPVRRNAWQGEPAGGAGPRSNGWVSAQQNTRELDAEAMGLMVAAALASGQAYNFMCSPCVIFDSPFEEEPGFASVPRMGRLIADKAPDVMRFSTRHHSGDTWRSRRILAATRAVRIDGAQSDDGRFLYTIDGPSGRHTLSVTRSFEGELIHPATGDITPVRKRVGEMLTLEFTRGRVLVGRVID